MAKYLINEIVKKAMILGTVRNLRKRDIRRFDGLNLWNLPSQTIFTPSFSDLIKKMYFTNEKENKFVRKK